MGAFDARRACGVGLLSVCTLLAACGKEDAPAPVHAAPAEAPAEAPAPRATPESTPTPAPAPAATAESEPRAHAIDVALRGLDSPELGQRRHAVQMLLQNDFALDDILRLALRATRWQKDCGLLADLLADYTEAALPLLLHRIGHSAPVHRAHLCEALGSARENVYPAFSIVLLRALLDEFEGTRAAARKALCRLSTQGPEILRLHDQAHEFSSNDDKRPLLPSVIIGPHPHPAYINVLIEVLTLELRRFPGVESFAVASMLADLAGTPDATRRIWSVLEEERFYGELLVRVLVGAGEASLPILRSHLQKQVRVSETLQAMALLGPAAVELGDLATPYLLSSEYGMDALRALWHTQANSDATQLALFQLWSKAHGKESTPDGTAHYAALLLKLLRPRGEVVTRVIDRLQGDPPDLHARATLIGLLGWCAKKQRVRARTFVQAILMSQPRRGSRVIAKQSLRLLNAAEDAMEARIGRELAKAP